MKRNALLIIGIMYIVPVFAFASNAVLFFSPASGLLGVGEEFSMKAMIDPGDSAVNAADATISFDNQLVSITKISKEGSSFSLWTTEPEFSNTKGTIVFGGGSPAGFSVKSTVFIITFKALKDGTVKFVFDSGSVLAMDGKGTDVLSQKIEGLYTVTDAVTTPTPVVPSKTPTEIIEPSGSVPKAPEIISSTHPDEGKWYNKNTVEFNWDLPTDVTEVRTLLSQESDDIPTVVHKPPIKTRKLENIEEGVWYFYAQFRNKVGWGQVVKKKISIDITSPLEFDIELRDQGADSAKPKLFFATEDTLSGLDHYEVRIGNGSFVLVSIGSLVDGAYKIPPQAGGEALVTVKAYDKAGNVRESSKQLLMPLVLPAAKETEAPQEGASAWGAERLLMLFFVFTTGAFAAINMYQRKQFKKELAGILKETLEMREKSDKIFSAMREEIEEQINALDSKPQLTVAEREVLEKLNEVLDISEELIDTEIDHLREKTRSNR